MSWALILVSPARLSHVFVEAKGSHSSGCIRFVMIRPAAVWLRSGIRFGDEKPDAIQRTSVMAIAGIQRTRRRMAGMAYRMF